MATTTFSTTASDVAVDGYNTRHVNLSFKADVSDVVANLTIEEIVAAVGASELLDEIGSEKAMSHWDLVEAEE